MIRRSFIKIGGDLTVDFANTAAPDEDRGSSLRSWRDLVDFLELRGAVSREEGAGLRAMGERDAHACAAAFERALELRTTVRAMLDALAARPPRQAAGVAAGNPPAGRRAGASRLRRDRPARVLPRRPHPAQPRRHLQPAA